MSMTECRTTYGDEPLHCLELFSIAVRVQLFSDVLDLVFRVIQVRRAGSSQAEVPRLLREGLLQSRAEPGGVFGQGVEVQRSHSGMWQSLRRHEMRERTSSRRWRVGRSSPVHEHRAVPGAVAEEAPMAHSPHKSLTDTFRSVHPNPLARRRICVSVAAAVIYR